VLVSPLQALQSHQDNENLSEPERRFHR